MGKITDKGSVPKDDPMFPGGVEFFTRSKAVQESNWHTIFQGSGSLTGNDWTEEVCYLGHEQWLLSLRDDPAWSISELTEQAEQRSSASLAEWVADMDTVDAEGCPRVESLLDVAVQVGAIQCEDLLRTFLSGRLSGG